MVAVPGNLYEKVSLIIHHSSPPKDVTILIVKIPGFFVVFFLNLSPFLLNPKVVTL